MNHRPFEDWLLEDQHLASDQERELQAHLRTMYFMRSHRRIEFSVTFHTDDLTRRRFCIPLRDAAG